MYMSCLLYAMERMFQILNLCLLTWFHCVVSFLHRFFLPDQYIIYIDDKYKNDDKYTHQNIPELLVFFVWHSPTLRCYLLDYRSYYICTNDRDYVAYWEETERIEMLANNFSLSQIQLGILVLVTTPGKFCNFPLL